MLTFAGLIVAGTLVLRLPVCHGDATVGWLDALFTATSAVCVTGLITIDTESGFSRTGQAVILVLIQLGGLGLMTFGAFAVQLFQRHVSFGSQAALQDTFFQSGARGDLKSALRKILVLTFLIETAGALLLRAGLAGSGPSGAGWFEAVFLSVSAFCNAGFSVYDDSVMRLRDSQLIMWTLMVLIVAGGLGYMVLLEVWERVRRGGRRRLDGAVRWSLNTRVVLFMSVLLVGGGAMAFLFSGLAHPDTSLPDLALHALFQSVTARTAGFNSVDMSLVAVPTLMIMIFLMFIGGSPGSCAGGVKTTSAAIWAARVTARLTGREHVNVGGRRVPHDVVRRASLVVAMAGLWNAAGIMILVNTENVGSRHQAADGENPGRELRFEHVIFEQVSAFATVGLSAGITSELSTPGRLWILVSMFVGRLGPLTVALAVMKRPRSPFAYPQERVMIG